MTMDTLDTSELAAKVVAYRTQVQALEDEGRELAKQMPTLPQGADIDLVVAGLHNDSYYLNHCLWLLGGKR
ncbi:MAG: hypothetical protein ACRDMV_04875 [Streptosporangiales bacterium]